MRREKVVVSLEELRINGEKSPDEWGSESAVVHRMRQVDIERHNT